MTKDKSNKDELEGSLKFFRILGYSFASISWLASGYGFYGIAQALGYSGPFMIAISMAISLIVQLLIVRLILYIASTKGNFDAYRGKARIALVLAWTISVGTSYGTAWFLLARPSYEATVRNNQIHALEIPIREAYTKINRANEALISIAAHAKIMENKEIKDGNSCGYQTAKKAGPRSRLRGRQNELAQTYSKSFVRKTADLKKVQNALQGTPRLSKVKAAYDIGYGTLKDPIILRTQNWTKKQITDFRSGFTDPITNQSFTCSDLSMVELLEVAKIALNDIPELPAAPNFSQIRMDEALIGGYIRMVNLIPGVKLQSAMGNNDASRAEDYGPILVPIVLESIMTLLLFLGAKPIKNPQGSGNSGSWMRRMKRTKFGRDEASDLAAWFTSNKHSTPMDDVLAKMEKLTLITEEGHFFVVPNKGVDGTFGRRIVHAIQQMAPRSMKIEARGFQMVELPDDHLKAFPSLNVDGRTADIYRVLKPQAVDSFVASFYKHAFSFMSDDDIEEETFH